MDLQDHLEVGVVLQRALTEVGVVLQQVPTEVRVVLQQALAEVDLQDHIEVGVVLQQVLTEVGVVLLQVLIEVDQQGHTGAGAVQSAFIGVEVDLRALTEVDQQGHTEAGAVQSALIGVEVDLRALTEAEVDWQDLEGVEVVLQQVLTEVGVVLLQVLTEVDQQGHTGAGAVQSALAGVEAVHLVAGVAAAQEAGVDHAVALVVEVDHAAKAEADQQVEVDLLQVARVGKTCKIVILSMIIQIKF